MVREVTTYFQVILQLGVDALFDFITKGFQRLLADLRQSFALFSRYLDFSNLFDVRNNVIDVNQVRSDSIQQLVNTFIEILHAVSHGWLREYSC